MPVITGQLTGRILKNLGNLVLLDSLDVGRTLAAILSMRQFNTAVVVPVFPEELRP